jgi:predicted transcriptional regulator
MYLGDAARLLGVTPAAVRKAVNAKRPSIRGLAPHSALNPTGKWAVSVEDVEAELRRRGRTPREPETSLADMRVEMLQGALSDAQQARVDQAEALVGELRVRLAEKEARVAQLEAQLASLARSVAEVFAAPAS